ncbi:MAG: hypothetical protein QW815_09295 [Nitrososphaerota archaeon]
MVGTKEAQAVEFFNKGRALFALLRLDGKVSVFLKQRDSEEEEGKLRLFVFPDLKALSATIPSLKGRLPGVFPLPPFGLVYVLERRQVRQFIRAARRWEVEAHEPPLEVME